MRTAGPAGRGRGPYGEARRQAGLRAKPSALRGPAGIARARSAPTANFPICGSNPAAKIPFVMPIGIADGPFSPKDTRNLKNNATNVDTTALGEFPASFWRKRARRKCGDTIEAAEKAPFQGGVLRAIVVKGVSSGHPVYGRTRKRGNNLMIKKTGWLGFKILF